jgi:hypothetical protein
LLLDLFDATLLIGELPLWTRGIARPELFCSCVSLLSGAACRGGAIRLSVRLSEDKVVELEERPVNLAAAELASCDRPSAPDAPFRPLATPELPEDPDRLADEDEDEDAATLALRRTSAPSLGLNSRLRGRGGPSCVRSVLGLERAESKLGVRVSAHATSESGGVRSAPRKVTPVAGDEPVASDSEDGDGLSVPTPHDCVEAVERMEVGNTCGQE